MRTKSTKAEDIRNPEHYFNRMIALEVCRDKEKEELRKAVEIPFGDRENSLSTYTDEISVDNFVFEDGAMEWLELIENDKLYHALTELSVRDQRIIIFYAICGITQKEIAKIMKMPQSNISRSIARIRKGIKKILIE